MKIKEEDIAKALEGSKDVEVHADGKKVRRVGGKAVPALDKKEGVKKRDDKAKDKEENKEDEKEEEIELDERGNRVFVSQDFENP